MAKPTLYEQLSNERTHNAKLKEERQRLVLELQEKAKETQNHNYLKALQKDYPNHNIRIGDYHLQMTTQKGNDYDLVYLGYKSFDKFLWSKSFDQVCRTTIAVIDSLETIKDTVLQDYTRGDNGTLIDEFDRCLLSYYEPTEATKDPRWDENEDKSQLHLMIDGDVVSGFLDWDAIYKKDAYQSDVRFPNSDHFSINNDSYRAYDKDTLKLALSHTFKASAQTLEKALEDTMAVKDNASITLQETESDKGINTFIITQKEKTL